MGRVIGEATDTRTKEQAVLITGAGSGIGRSIAEKLVAEGYLVYGGARSDRQLLELERLGNVRPLRLDITSKSEIEAAVDVVAADGVGLYGLVNNAGVGSFGPIVGGDDEEFELVMEVNVLGTYRVTRAFAPFIIARRGRIVNIGSISGILASENVAAYSMSKHALEAFTDSLAAELQSFGVHVSVIEPGAFRTSIAETALKRTRSHRAEESLSAFPEPGAVADTAVMALFEAAPKRRYLVVSTEHEAHRTV
jgi:NAD(P)-dependent dehydrogenase (short-subunit alcohol dehydrogenase family)